MVILFLTNERKNANSVLLKPLIINKIVKYNKIPTIMDTTTVKSDSGLSSHMPSPIMNEAIRLFNMNSRLRSNFKYLRVTNNVSKPKTPYEIREPTPAPKMPIRGTRAILNMTFSTAPILNIRRII